MADHVRAPRLKAGRLLLGSAALIIGVTVAAYASAMTVSIPSVSPFPEGLAATSDGTL